MDAIFSLFGECAPPGPLYAPALFIEPVVFSWAAGLFALQIILQFLLPLFAKKGGALAGNADMVAHQFCVTIPFVYAAVMGTKLLFFDESIVKMDQGAYTDRLYGFHPTTWVVTRMFAGFQVYDLCATAVVPSLRKAEHLAHHVLSLLTACAGLSGPLLQFYCPFFFGFVEVSSVPLAFVDIFRMVPPTPGTFLSACNEVVRIMFAVLFLPIRCYMFPRALVNVYADLLAAYTANDVRNPIALAWFAFSGSVLCAMQLYWGFKIVRILYRQATGTEGNRQKEA